VSATAERRARAEAVATRIYSERRDYLLRIARWHALNDDDAEEALQDTFVAFIEKADPDQIAEPLAWLTLALKRECWGRRRTALRRTPGQEADPQVEGSGFVLDQFEHPGQGPEELAELSEQVELTRELLAQLKPQERRALTLKALGYSYSEIGELTGWTYTKINRCLAEGRKRLFDLAAAAEGRD
jgi:RNA polymerase sigma factor (sigma-70 family)